MLFNSGPFLQFFAAFLLLFYVVRHNLTWRNLLIVGASYFFYGWWDYRFLSLLIISSFLDFFVGIALEKTGELRRRKFLVALSAAGNLTILGFFKYFDFFVSSAADLFSTLGIPFETRSLGVVLPVGISFYTFQTMSYTIDVYRGQTPATRNLIQFLAYVSFFPQLVAGPIERARHLLPQFGRTLSITTPRIRDGLWLCILGLFKKVVIADNLAPLVEMVYGKPTDSGPMVVLATIAFGFQIYGDFSGYSDMARGLAKLLGFDLMLNFHLPYVATNIREFWSRWHISLSTWLRDYLYISLGGNRCGSMRTHMNLFVTMLLGGLWHGAAWNFVLWGCWHGAGLVLHRWFVERRGGIALDSTATRAFSWMTTMVFVFYGWLLFRAGSRDHIVQLTRALLNTEVPIWAGNYGIAVVTFVVPLAIFHVWHRKRQTPVLASDWSPTRAALAQGLLLIPIVVFWEKEHIPFIYFQF